MHQRDFRGAIEQIKFLDPMLHDHPLIELKALDEMRAITLQRLEKCHRKILLQLERE
jgi:hypothetical protein